MKIAFGISTCDRGPINFVHDTIESLSKTGFFKDAETGPLVLSVGAPDASFLGRYKNDPRFSLNPLTPEEALTFPPHEKLTRSTRCSFGAYRCLQKLLERQWDYALLCEDDLKFAMGWLPWLRVTLNRLIADPRSRWVLTLYLPHAETRLWYQRGLRWFETAREIYCGSQALLFPRWAAEAMLPELRQEIDKLSGVATDMVLARMLIRLGIPLYATTPCLVQHTGKVSVGCDLAAVVFHQAGLFLESV